jgi:hypothetical protein
MRGEWRSDFLLVAAAQRQVAALAGEGQQQQQDEELLGREPHSCVAGVSLDSAEIRSGSKALVR